ncbi:hypothetical protein GS4_17_00320 [Gordonia soli NBRC 108243]|uniref:Uncharacterized protein n=1 Tax=Gordonia soli NBRC 108243 TaxID=1223545 RepID=M0QK30_9ACTN|nr:hypothetical protein GS4_17_00320 [Gordonia soli NBRC 108243]
MTVTDVDPGEARFSSVGGEGRTVDGSERTIDRLERTIDGLRRTVDESERTVDGATARPGRPPATTRVRAWLDPPA